MLSETTHPLHPLPCLWCPKQPLMQMPALIENAKYILVYSDAFLAAVERAGCRDETRNRMRQGAWLSDARPGQERHQPKALEEKSQEHFCLSEKESPWTHPCHAKIRLSQAWTGKC